MQMENGRQSVRQRVLKSGTIRFGDVAIPCVLRNLSTAGVALDVGSQDGVPDQFTLIVHTEKNPFVYSDLAKGKVPRRRILLAREA
jgi:hypothetical protein